MSEWSRPIKAVDTHAIELTDTPDDSDLTAIACARIYLVRWGERRYLVPDTTIAQLVEDIRISDTDMRMESAFVFLPLHASDLDKPPHGALHLPDPWATFLTRPPVAARVVSVTRCFESRAGGDPAASVEVFDIAIDQGTGAGTFVGQELFWNTVLGHVVTADHDSAVLRVSGLTDGETMYLLDGRLPRIGDPVASLLQRSYAP